MTKDIRSDFSFWENGEFISEADLLEWIRDAKKEQPKNTSLAFQVSSSGFGGSFEIYYLEEK